MELYLNVIEFGPGIYGVGAAADYYFGRTPAELDLTECLFLASLLPAPVRYGAMREAGQVPESWMRVIRSLLATARRNGRITDAELADAEKQTIVFWQGGDRPTPRAPVRSRPGLEVTPEPTTAPSDSPDGP
jgi:membrane peptidoglycan carboxypeptidase